MMAHPWLPQTAILMRIANLMYQTLAARAWKDASSKRQWLLQTAILTQLVILAVGILLVQTAILMH